MEARGYAAHDSSGTLYPLSFTRRATGAEDVRLRITHCGMCHSDLSYVRNEWRTSQYPVVPGHEIVGVVTEVGASVKDLKAGDHAGVGCMVGCCGGCQACATGAEQFCRRIVWTYGSVDAEDDDGSITQGGYSDAIVVKRRFVVRVPDNLPLDAAAPLLCAGITVYSPMKHFGMMRSGAALGVVGLGGLGHMAVKFAKAFGLQVTVVSSSPRKQREALDVLGAHRFLVSTDPDHIKEAMGSLDYIIDTVSASHPIGPLLSLLKVDGKMVLVGIPQLPLQIHPGPLIFGRRSISGSCIGSIAETQEMLDFCGEKNITCTIEKVAMADVNTAMERLAKSDVRYRFVLDVEGMGSTVGLDGLKL